MAQGNQNNSELWAKSAANCKYALGDDNLPLIGISGDEGAGHIVPVPPPAWFHTIPTEGERDNVFRALVGHATRVGQAKYKSEKTPTREHAVSGVASALNGTYTPGKSSDNDIIDQEANRRFVERIRGLVMAAKPTATDGDIAATVDSQLAKESGKKLLASMKAAVLNDLSYSPQRKGKGSKPAAIDIALDAD